MTNPVVFTEKAYREMGCVQCPDCSTWFKPRRGRGVQVYCRGCENSMTEERAGGRPDPRGKLINQGLEEWDG